MYYVTEIFLITCIPCQETNILLSLEYKYINLKINEYIYINQNKALKIVLKLHSNFYNNLKSFRCLMQITFCLTKLLKYFSYDTDTSVKCVKIKDFKIVLYN